MLYCLLVSFCTATVPGFPTTTWNASTSSDVRLIFNFSSKIAEGHKHYSSFQQQTQNGEPTCLRPRSHTSTGREFRAWGRSTLPCVLGTAWVPSAWEKGGDRHTAISRSLNSQSLWDCSQDFWPHYMPWQSCALSFHENRPVPLYAQHKGKRQGHGDCRGTHMLWITSQPTPASLQLCHTAVQCSRHCSIRIWGSFVLR